MRTTYVIGAGASKAVWGFPVMQDFLSNCASELAVQTAGPGETLREFIEARFGMLAEVNLEDVLTDLDNTLLGLGRIWYGASDSLPRLEAQSVKSALIQVIRARLMLPANLPSPDLSAYDQVFAGQGEGTSIITFNYDCGLERYQGRFGDPEKTRFEARYMLCDSHPHGAYFGASASPDIRYPLKLHGSLDYICCSNPDCPLRLVIDMPEGTDGSSDPVRECPDCGADMETVIIPPSMSKALEKHPKLTLLWRLALEAIRTAERLVVWGFSCPSTDHHVAWLLRSVRQPDGGNLKQVSVIDPKCDEVLVKLRRLIDPNNLLSQVQWEPFCDTAAYAKRCTID